MRQGWHEKGAIISYETGFLQSAKMVFPKYSSLPSAPSLTGHRALTPVHGHDRVLVNGREGARGGVSRAGAYDCE